MTDKQKEIVDLYVQGIINDNMYQFEDVLFQGVTADMSAECIYSKMIFNSIRLSTSLATQIIFDFLENQELVSFKCDEQFLQKTALKMRTENNERKTPPL